MTVITYLSDKRFFALVDRLIAAASTLHDDPQLIERDEIIVALVEADIFPESTRESIAA